MASLITIITIVIKITIKILVTMIIIRIMIFRQRMFLFKSSGAATSYVHVLQHSKALI